MEALREVTAVAAPLMRANVDTDQIIPTRFLARPSEEGLGEGLFAEWATDPKFVLNQAPYRNAGILLAGANFGCGSSREAAPRALRQRGFRAVVAPSFGDIFFNNCFRNGIVPIRLPMAVVERLAAHAGMLHVDLAQCIIEAEGGAQRHRFDVPPRLHRMLLEGMDEIALTLTQRGAIDSFRTGDRQRRPWAYLQET